VTGFLPRVLRFLVRGDVINIGRQARTPEDGVRQVNRGAALAIVLATAACAGPRPAPTDPPASKEATMSGSDSPAGDPHPGQIVFDDHVEHRTWTEAASAVPPTMAWVKVGDRYKPVVLIEIDGMGDRREITAFGPDREFLQHTTARLGPPPSAPSTPTPTPTPTATPSR